jgi:serine/threonine protein kinase
VDLTHTGVCSVLGTPTEEMWPGVTTLPEFNASGFPKWQAHALSAVIKGLDAAGLDLMTQMLQYDPSRRISAKAALNHPYFADVNKAAAVPLSFK